MLYKQLRQFKFNEYYKLTDEETYTSDLGLCLFNQRVSNSISSMVHCQWVDDTGTNWTYLDI